MKKAFWVFFFFGLVVSVFGQSVIIPKLGDVITSPRDGFVRGDKDDIWVYKGKAGEITFQDATYSDVGLITGSENKIYAISYSNGVNSFATIILNLTFLRVYFEKLGCVEMQGTYSGVSVSLYMYPDKTIFALVDNAGGVSLFDNKSSFGAAALTVFKEK